MTKLIKLIYCTWDLSFFMNIIINFFTRYTIESKHYIQCTVTLLIHQIYNTVIINRE